MTFKDFEKLQTAIFILVQNTGKTKGREYANDNSDRLANFKRTGLKVNLEPEKVLQVFLQKHEDSIDSYVNAVIRGEEPWNTASEPIELRILDSVLYRLLLLGLLIERKAQYMAYNEDMTMTTNEAVSLLVSELLEKATSKSEEKKEEKEEGEGNKEDEN